MNALFSLCDEILENKTSPNIDVIKLIKREFEEQCDSLISEYKVKVLNNKYDLWAVRTIYDSAFFDTIKIYFGKFLNLLKYVNI